MLSIKYYRVSLQSWLFLTCVPITRATDIHISIDFLQLRFELFELVSEFVILMNL